MSEESGTMVTAKGSSPQTDPVDQGSLAIMKTKRLLTDREDAVVDKKIDSDHNITGEEDSDDDDKEKDKGIKDNEAVSEKNIKDLEKQEEAKLRAKYPDMKTQGASSFLQKRLSKGNKYFDSGDYNMAKAKVGSAKPVIGPSQKVVLPGPTGDAIPTPETVPHKKISNVQSKLVNTHSS